MKKIEYNEELVISTGLNIELNSKIFLTDLLRLEYSEELRFDLVCLYLKDLVKETRYSFTKCAENKSKDTIILLEDWSLVLCSASLLFISPLAELKSLSRENLKEVFEIDDYSGEVHSLKISVSEGYSYVIIAICKLWVSSDQDFEKIINCKHYEGLINSARNDIGAYIYSKTKLSPKSILFKINEAKELITTPSLATAYEIEENPSKILSINAAFKPYCDIFILNNRTSVESFNYTNSEETGRLETSFRLSNTIAGRFPKLSGTSIAILETPSKETKKSFGEYAEFMESPKFSSCNGTPYKLSNSTPIHSPKQSVYSIQQLKSFLIPDHKKVSTGTDSPFEKEPIKRVRSPGLKTFTFHENDFKSLISDSNLTLSSEFTKTKTLFEEKKSSCQCQACNIY
jgi:hypothetical protein